MQETNSIPRNERRAARGLGERKVAAAGMGKDSKGGDWRKV